MSLDMSKEQAAGMAPALARMLTTLEQKVDPSHAALIVVDVQNDWCSTGGYLDKEYGDMKLVQDMVPKLIKFIQKARQMRLPIIYVQCEYNTENTWYLSDVWLEQANRKRSRGGYIKYPVCEANSWGADFYGGIKPLQGEVVVKKHRYSAFVNTDLDLILRSKGIRTLIISGVASNCCAEITAIDGFVRDYYIVFLRDCTAPYCQEHCQELHEASLRRIDNLFGVVVDSTDVAKCWEKTESS